MMADFVVPGHSAVVERLRRRIELIRRHHSNCENRYEKTAMERLEMDRQQTFAMHQRCQQTKAKHKNKHRQPPAASADPVPQRGTGGGGAELVDGGNGTPGEQSRNSTLIALQETVKRKLENAGSPLGHEHGFGDGYPPSKNACVEDALGALNGVKNGVVPPLSPIETKHSTRTDSIVPNDNHRVAAGMPNGADITDSGMSCGSESDFRLKEMKQEPVDDILPCILHTGGASGSNNLFPDLNLNDQDWTEIMEEFNRSVPYEDIQELFSVGFGDRKDPEVLSTGKALGLIPPDLASVKTEFPPASATSTFDQDSCTGSPLVRPTSSGPLLQTNPPLTAPPTSPALPVPHHPKQPSIQPTRPLQNHLLPGPPKDMSPAQQLQQLAAREHHRTQILQSQPQHVAQKQQQQQATQFLQQPNHPSSWPQSTPSQSQLGGTFRIEKPTSPSLYPKNLPKPKTLLMPGQQPNKSSSKPATSAGYMQSAGRGNIQSHPAAPMGPLNHPPNPGGQAAMLDYSNTKPLSHYEAGVPGASKGPPTTQNKPNQAILNLMRHQQMQKHRPPGINFLPAHIQHTPEPGSYNTPLVPGNTMTPQPSGNSVSGNHGNAAYMKQQQMHLSQQQKQFLQRQMMAEQEKQRQQQEQQLQRHLTRPPPQYQDQQNQQAQQNPFQPQQQQVSQFTGTSQTIVNVNSCGPAPAAQQMFSQTQSMMGMGVGQSGGPPPGAPSVASQADMNLPPCAGGLDVIYGNMPLHSSHPNQQRPLVQTMSAAYHQNILTVQQQPHLKSQPNTAILKHQQKHLVRIPNSTPNVIANNMSSSMPSSIQGALPTQPQPWQQQPQQHPGLQQAMGSQPGCANGGMTAGFPSSGFLAQSRMTKLSNNAPFSPVGMGNSVAGRSLAGMNPGHIMPNIKQQRTNNPAMEQHMPPSNQQTPQQGQPVPQTQQVLTDLGPFSQAQTVPSCTAGLQSNQAYQLNRTASQQLQFGYNSQSSGSLSGFTAETELDSLLKNHSTQEWMDDLDELLASHQ